MDSPLTQRVKSTSSEIRLVWRSYCILYCLFKAMNWVISEDKLAELSKQKFSCLNGAKFYES